MARFLPLMLALALAGAATAARPPVRVSRPPAGLRVGQAWHVTVTAQRVRPTRFVAVFGRRVLRFRLRRVGSHQYRARVVFPSAGAWRYGVALGRRTVFVGRLSVRLAKPSVEQVYGVVQEAAGTLLVADFAQGAVFRIDPVRDEGLRVARVDGPRDLKRAPDGRILVSSVRDVVALDPTTGATSVVAHAQGNLEGIAADTDGSLYVVEDQARLVRIGPGGGRMVLVSGRNGIHGILLTSAGVIVCEAYAGNVLRVDSNGVHIVASGLGNPSYALPAPDGGVYVSEFTGNRISHIDNAGRVTAVAQVPGPGPITYDSVGRILVGNLDGEIFRVDGGAATQIWP